MAAAAQPPPEQQQPAAPDPQQAQGAPAQKPHEQPPRHPHNASALLESMQAMLNGALLEIGHSMKNPQRPKLTFPSTQGLNGPRHNNISITASSERFHHCLDEIEHELFRAKAILRRDLAVQREEREKRETVERERAAEAEKKMAAEMRTVPTAVMASAAPKQQEKQQKDVEMADAAPAAATNSSKPAAETPSVAAHTHLPPRPPAIQTANNDASAPPAPATATTDDLFGRTPTTAGVNNADFDSMFEDFANANDNGDARGDTSMGADGGNDEFDFALLPGIESYANSDNNNASGSNPNKDNSTAAPEIDFSALDKAPSHNQAQEDEQKKKQEEEEKKKQEEEETRKKEEEEKKKKEEEEKQQQQDNQDLNEVFQGDSTFDDLFNYTDFDMGGAGGSTGGGDTTFDDDFFNI